LRQSFAAAPLNDLRHRYSGLSGAALLRPMIRHEFPGRLAVVSSFGAESAALLALVAELDRHVPVLFLDTGRLFGETLRYRDSLAAALGLTDVRTFHPPARELAESDAQGLLWHSDPDRCCMLRKVTPLATALQGFDAWVSGRKRYQGAARGEIPVFEVDDTGRVKINPLAGWSQDQIEEVFIEQHLPRHPLVADGYPSIGCISCTDRVQSGEEPRIGRWRGRRKTECGIHLSLQLRGAP
jgi:phosphoadenosine phosphosulfate reductase